MFSRNAEPFLHKAFDIVTANMRPIYNCINFRAVAGARDNTFQYAVRLLQLCESFRQVRLGHRKSFADFHRSGSVIEANNDNMNVKSPAFP